MDEGTGVGKSGQQGWAGVRLCNLLHKARSLPRISSSGRLEKEQAERLSGSGPSQETAQPAGRRRFEPHHLVPTATKPCTGHVENLRPEHWRLKPRAALLARPDGELGIIRGIAMRRSCE